MPSRFQNSVGAIGLATTARRALLHDGCGKGGTGRSLDLAEGWRAGRGMVFSIEDTKPAWSLGFRAL